MLDVVSSFGLVDSGHIPGETRPKTNSELTPENRGPLESRRFLLESIIFRGELLVSGRIYTITTEVMICRVYSGEKHSHENYKFFFAHCRLWFE